MRTSSNRTFGLVFAGVFLLLAFHGAWRGNPHWWVWFVVSYVFCILALIAPPMLAPLNQAWTRLGNLLHKIVSPIFCAALFFVLFTPIGFLMRVCGKDPLRRKWEATADSYWIVRKSGSNFKDQF